MGKHFDYALRILMFLLATINFVFAAWFLDRRTRMNGADGRKYIATWQDYHIICGIIITPYLDFVLVWWGQHMRSSTQKGCKFIL